MTLTVKEEEEELGSWQSVHRERKSAEASKQATNSSFSPHPLFVVCEQQPCNNFSYSFFTFISATRQYHFLKKEGDELLSFSLSMNPFSLLKEAVLPPVQSYFLFALVYYIVAEK